MSRIVRGVLVAIAGFAAGAVIGGALVALASGNTHDKSQEIVMTAAFVTGPIGAVAGLLAGLLWRRRSAG